MTGRSMKMRERFIAASIPSFEASTARTLAPGNSRNLAVGDHGFARRHALLDHRLIRRKRLARRVTGRISTVLSGFTA